MEYIEQMFQQKGISYDERVLKKGILTLKTLPDCKTTLNNFELPSGLLSNPIYKKFPLWISTFFYDLQINRYI